MKSNTGNVLNLNHMILPLALLKVTGAFRKMKKGETLEILTNNQETREDLFKVLGASSYELIEMNETESLCRILLRKM